MLHSGTAFCAARNGHSPNG